MHFGLRGRCGGWLCVSVSGGEAGSEAGGPGPGRVSPLGLTAAGGSGSGPAPQTPEMLCLSEEKEKDKERVAGRPHGADSAGEEGRGLRGG